MAERVLVAGTASGPVLVLDEPISFWGGFDPATGLVIDRRHPQEGTSISGTILVMEAGRGSSSASNGLAEAIRRGTAPAAIVMLEPDEILVIGALVASELYDLTVPIVVVDETTFRSLRSGSQASLDSSGRLTVP
jgi:hypothetical protein